MSKNESKEKGRAVDRFASRRKRNAILTAVVVLLIGCVVWWMNRSLLGSAFFSGYVLIGSVFLLAAFGMRKRLPMIDSIGSAAFWMQLHIWVGLGSFAVFAMHVGLHVPDGWLEVILAGLYLFVFGSGIYGLYATRTFPEKLTALSEEVIFEKIPFLRRELARRAKALALEACDSDSVLANLYANRLAGFFEKRRGLVYAIKPTGTRRRQLIAEIDDLDRYLASDQRQVSRQMAILVRRKDDLDYHDVIQGRLKLWLFVHISLTWSLLTFAIVHGLLAHAFGGGLS